LAWIVCLLLHNVIRSMNALTAATHNCTSGTLY